MEQLTDQFQSTVRSMLIRHQSILDILSKGQETSARVNRAVVKSATNCGCHSVNAHKKPLPSTASAKKRSGRGAIRFCLGSAAMIRADASGIPKNSPRC